MLHSSRRGIDIQPAETCRTCLLPDHHTELSVRQQPVKRSFHPCNHAVGGYNFIINHLIRFVNLSFQIVAIRRALHIVINHFFLFGYFSLMKNTGLVVVDRIDKIAASECCQACFNVLGFLCRNCLRIEKFILPRVINTGTVHHDHRHRHSRFPHLEEEKGRSVLGNQGYLCTVVKQIIQPHKYSRRNPGKPVRHKILCAYKENPVFVLPARKMGSIYQNSDECPHIDVKNTNRSRTQRIINVRITGNNADINNGCESRCIRNPKYNRRIDG